MEKLDLSKYQFVGVAKMVGNNLFGEPVFEKTKKHITNKVFILSAQIAKITSTTPNRWLRKASKYPIQCERAINELNEAKSVHNKAGYFIALLKKFTNKPVDN